MADSEARNLTAETAASASRHYVGQDGTDRMTRTPGSLVGRFEIDTTYNSSANHADFSLEVGKRHLVHLGGLTSEVVVTLPASANVGEQCAITITADAPSTQGYEAEITAASGDTLNGVSGGTEWSRLFIANETLVFECEAADATWRVVHDGRIPCHGFVHQSSNLSGKLASNSTWYQMTYDTQIENWGDVLLIANDYFQPRRAGLYRMHAHATTQSLTTASEQAQRFSLDPTGTPVVLMFDAGSRLGSTGNQNLHTWYDWDVAAADIGSATAGRVYHEVRINSGAPKDIGGSAARKTMFNVIELLRPTAS